VGLILLVLAQGCGDGDEAAPTLPDVPATASAPGQDSPPPSPTTLSVAAARAEAATAACAFGPRAELYEVPDPFGSLIPSGGEWDGEPWLIGKFPCSELEVIGPSEPLEVTFESVASGAPFCPYLAVRHGRDRGWVSACVSQEALDVLPPVVPMPLSPGGRPDLAIDAERAAEEGDTCSSLGGGPYTGWRVLVRNEGDGTSSELLELVFLSSSGKRETEMYRLIRGLEPGEELRLSYTGDGTTVRLDPEEKTPDADRANNELHLGDTPDLVCG